MILMNKIKNSPPVENFLNKTGKKTIHNLKQSIRIVMVF